MSGFYIFSPKAREDLKDIKDYIGSYNLNAAQRLIESIRQKCRTIAAFPNMGRSYSDLEPGLRGVTLNNYLILYRPIKNGIEIVRVVSGYRDLDALFSEDEPNS